MKSCVKITKAKILIMIIAIMLVSLCIGVFTQQAKAVTPTMIWVDSPVENSTQKQSLSIQGWILSQERDKTIKFYIDKTEITEQITFFAREDVFQAIQGYGSKAENPEPGYKGNIDISNLTDGRHTLTIEVLDNASNSEIAKKEIPFNVKKYDTLLQYDTPTENQNVKTNLEIQGWVLSEDPEATVEIQFNGQTYTPERQARIDVLNAINGYGGSETNKTPGYKINIDTSNIKDGTFGVNVIVKSRIGEIIAQQTRNVTIKKYDTLLQYDTPTENQNLKTNLQVQGWVLSEDPEATVEIQFNGQTYTPERQARTDIFSVVGGFGGQATNPTPGYKINIDTSEMKDGTYGLTIIVKSKIGDIITQQTRNINIKKYDGFVQLDKPTGNVTATTNIEIQGWAISEDIDATVEIHFNGQTYIPERQARTDIFSVVGGFGGQATNPTPGYKITIDATNISDGTHTLSIIIKSRMGDIIEQYDRNINLKKYLGYITIDYPQAGTNNKNSLYIQGWNLSAQANRRVEVYLNGNNVTGNISTYARNDAVDAMQGKGYGDISTNGNAGFGGTVDISGYGSGDYTLTVRVLSNVTNDVIEEKSISIGINKIEYEKGVFGYSGLKVKGDGRGQDLRYYKIGNGPNVFFGVFTLHGFEDNFGRDGTEISVIAENFVNKLLADQDSSLLSKWTIYVFPDVNTDGRNYGWTNDGPGRTTLTNATGSNGVDLNRCWSTSFTPMYNSRNYTGSQPFLAYEARYLRDFLLSRRATNGQTILVDLHGWTTQVIGDSGICSYYNQQFPSCRYTSSYGKGYLINWARENLGANGRVARSALIELPNIGTNGQKIMSHQDVVNSGYSDKYINATLNMLRSIV